MSQETYDVSKWNFALMGLLDCLALLLTIVPGGRVPAPVTVVLVQVRAPFPSSRPTFAIACFLGVAVAMPCRCGVDGLLVVALLCGVCTQVLTPCNHVVGVLFRSFRSKYSAVHYGGSVLILAGGVVSILPLLTSCVCVCAVLAIVREFVV